jgi:FdhE protein
MKKPEEKIDAEYPSPPSGGKAGEAIDDISEDFRPLEDMSVAFKPLYVERDRLKAALSPPRNVFVSPPDPFRFNQGVPLLTIDHLVDLTDSWEQAAGPLIRAMAAGFTSIKGDLQKLDEALKDDRLHRRDWVDALLQGREVLLESAASSLGIESRTFKFVLGQLLKPCMEKRVKAFKPLVQNLRWTMGYCPLCGALPELGLVKSDHDGERLLLCALCGHQWPFPGTACPYCGGEDHEEKEFYAIEGRGHQWAELCHGCKRYLVCIDLTGRPEVPAFETASAGIVHLDVLAQQRGFLPVAVCPWNVVVREDIAREARLEPETEVKRVQLH